MKKILIPVDGTERSLATVRSALRPGPSAISRIDLVNVQPLFHRHIARWTSRRTREAWRAERSSAALDPARRLVELAGIPCSTHALAGPHEAMIREAARALGADEVVSSPRPLAERYAIPAGLGLIALLLLADE
jgi:nucleotide-binding universal stress UspA family protein